MNSHVDCIACIINKANQLADKYIQDKKVKYEFMNKVLLEVTQIKYSKTAPYLCARVMRILQDMTGIEDFYEEEKNLFNKKLLSMETDIKKSLLDSQNRFLDAIKIAMAGNVVDFGALDDISIELVEEIISKSLKTELSLDVYEKLNQQLSSAQVLLYIGDNTGEIVFDKIFIEEIYNKYKDLEIYFATRGKPALNDATEKDAYFIGIDKYAKIINNGTDIPGTDLEEVSDDFKKIYYNKADVIISKGQGNFETLLGCGDNIFYLLLCKCSMLSERLNIDRFQPIFLYEMDVDSKDFDII
ncbi:MAG: ARMT1-like domain-containing protein [Vallitalea sp.]|jgi:uncharacterized protein with ATP-grasp and redox domains|nr:ARMT1-like domain-containing protein [Vallitalea sp.]